MYCLPAASVTVQSSASTTITGSSAHGRSTYFLSRAARSSAAKVSERVGVVTERPILAPSWLRCELPGIRHINPHLGPFQGGPGVGGTDLVDPVAGPAIGAPG